MSEATDPSDPLAELAAKVAVLTARVDAQDHIMDALALSVPLSRRRELLELLDALRLNAAARGEQDAASAVQLFVERFQALADPDLSAPASQAIQRLHMQRLLFEGTPAPLRLALETWLAQATADEIVQEHGDKLASLLDAAAAAKPKRKRKPPRT